MTNTSRNTSRSYLPVDKKRNTGTIRWRPTYSEQGGGGKKDTEMTNNECKALFEDIKSYYEKESRDISWRWEDLASNNACESILFYLAFNLSKNVIHGPLPQQLHNRMALDTNQFSKAYFDYLDGNVS